MADTRYTFARTVIHLRIYVILICFILTVFFVGVLKDITVENALRGFFAAAPSLCSGAKPSY